MLWMLYATIIMGDKVGEYGLEADIWVMAQHEESKKYWFGLNILRNSNFSTFTFETMWFDFQLSVKDWGFVNS